MARENVSDDDGYRKVDTFVGGVAITKYVIMFVRSDVSHTERFIFDFSPQEFPLFALLQANDEVDLVLDGNNRLIKIDLAVGA